MLLVSIGAICAPTAGNPCSLHDGNPVPTLGERRRLEGSAQVVWRLFDAEQRDIVLTEGEIDGSELVEGDQLPRIDLDQANMGHSPRDDLRFACSGAFLTPGTLGFPVHVSTSLKTSYNTFLSSGALHGSSHKALRIYQSHASTCQCSSRDKRDCQPPCTYRCHLYDETEDKQDGKHHRSYMLAYACIY